MFCYVLYFFLQNNEFGNHSIVILVVSSTFIFFIFTFILSAMIAMIDVEAKKGLHNMVKRALKISTKRHIFPVCILLKYYKFIFFKSPSFFQIRMYMNRVLMSTIGLEVLEKPINFENILNVETRMSKGGGLAKNPP